MSKLIVDNGKKFGMLTVIEEAPSLRLPSGQVNRAFKCICDCGNIKVVRLAHLIRNKIKSCGCLSGTNHGECKTHLYGIWRGMKNRCYGNKTVQPHLYKDKGITVCSEWMKYLGLKEWAMKNGYKEGLQIDRIDNSKGYCPENCRFVTPKENTNNRGVTFYVNYYGRKVSFAMLLAEQGKDFHYNSIRSRIKRGWDETTAIDTPIRQGNYYVAQNNKQRAIK